MDSGVDKSLTGDQVQKVAGESIRTMTYPDVHKYATIQDLLGPDEAVIMLYLTHERYGHWIAIFKRRDKRDGKAVIEFFDPYGIFPDRELAFTDKTFKKNHNMDHPYILKLLHDYEGPVEYNHYKFQKRQPGVSTCGRHVGMRLLLRDMSLDQYWNFLNRVSKSSKVKDLDTLITKLSDQQL